MRFVIVCFLNVGVIILRHAASGEHVTLHGEGATFPGSVYQKWSETYREYRSDKKLVDLTYKPTSSSMGMRSLLETPESVKFIGSDYPLSNEDALRNQSDLLVFPTLAGGIILAYNLPTCPKKNGIALNLTRLHVVGIFNGTFTWWNDSSIQDINPNCNLPAYRIIVIARRVSSGSTSVFTSALSAFDSNWKIKIGTFSEGAELSTDKPIKWLPGVIKYYGATNGDVASLVKSIFYSVSYLSLGEAEANNMSFAAIGNRFTEFVLPGSDTLKIAMNYHANDSTLTPQLVDTDIPGAYPIASYTYVIFYRTYDTDCATAMEMIRFFMWLTTDPQARSDAFTFGFFTLNDRMSLRVFEEVFKRVTCGGQLVMDLIASDTEDVAQDPGWLIPVAVTVSVCMLLFTAMCAYIIYQRYKLTAVVDKDNWDIPIEDIVFFFDDKIQLTSACDRSKFLRQKSVKSFLSVGQISEGPELLSQILQWPGKWGANTIGIRLLDVLDFRKVTREMERAILWMKHSVINTNVVRFYGLTELDGSRYVIGDYCSKGTILDILQNNRYNLSEDLKMAVALEIASGMSFLHMQGLVHGMLTSHCCMLDNKWTVKIADWEYCKLFSMHKVKMNPMLAFRTKSILTQDKNDVMLKAFWTAPEILRSEFTEWPTQSCDVYSYAIILHEIFTRDEPYIELAHDMSPEEILDAIVNNRLRPEPNSDIPMSIRQITELAWSDIPSSRPYFEQMVKMLRRSQREGKTIMDSMMETMEDYTCQLEEDLNAKENALYSLKLDHDKVISDMFPACCLPGLGAGEVVEPMMYTALGVVMVTVEEAEVSLDSCDTVFDFIDKFREDLKTITIKYNAFCPHCPFRPVHLFLLGLDLEPFSLDERCLTVARMAMDILKLGSSGNDLNPPVMRISAHVGPVAVGRCRPSSPHCSFRGPGLDVGQCLVSAARQGTVYISRCLFSQIEKNPEFCLVARDAEWIPCNGTDIEAFVLKGRELDSKPTRSNVSSDSGVGGDTHESIPRVKHAGGITSISAGTQRWRQELFEPGAVTCKPNYWESLRKSGAKLKCVLRREVDTTRNGDCFLAHAYGTSARLSRLHVPVEEERADTVDPAVGGGKAGKSTTYAVQNYEKDTRTIGYRCLFIDEDTGNGEAGGVHKNHTSGMTDVNSVHYLPDSPKLVFKEKTTPGKDLPVEETRLANLSTSQQLIYLSNGKTPIRALERTHPIETAHSSLPDKNKVTQDTSVAPDVLARNSSTSSSGARSSRGKFFGQRRESLERADDNLHQKKNINSEFSHQEQPVDNGRDEPVNGILNKTKRYSRKCQVQPL